MENKESNRYLYTEIACGSSIMPEAEEKCKQLLAAIKAHEAAKDVQYYIIKNPDTGLYYRGKGVNRWGKYMNQASIFRIKGQVEDSCDWINKCHRDGERAVIVPIKIIELDSEIK